MKEISVEEFKTNFSQVIEEVKSGEQIAVTNGKSNQIIGYFMPENTLEMPKRKLGILAGKSEVIFRDDFEMTDKEFIDL